MKSHNNEVKQKQDEEKRKKLYAKMKQDKAMDE